MRVRYTVPASVDLDKILDLLATVSPGAVRRLAERVEDVERVLASHPEAGAVTKLHWLRSLKTRSYPYLVFYEVTDDAVLIHAVRHAARKPLDEPGA